MTQVASSNTGDSYFALKALSGMHAVFGTSPRKWRRSRLLLQGLARLWLRRVVLSGSRESPNEITVLIPVRNRCDYRLVNALRSLRAQTFFAIQIIVVDYGSEPVSAAQTRDWCSQFGAAYEYVPGVSVWSRSRCLNVGLRMTTTKFVMVSDVDMIFSPDYVAAALQALSASPFSVICSPMYDLPQGTVPALTAAAGSQRLEVDLLRKCSTPRWGDKPHASILITYTAFLKVIGGYDEFYTGWGSEDDDLMFRLTTLGLHQRGLGPNNFYLHQWHPKFEGVTDWKASAQRNRAYFMTNRTILRNVGG